MHYDDYDFDCENERPQESDHPDFDDQTDCDVIRIEEESTHDSYNFFPDSGF